MSQIDDNERPTAIESATHAIPPTDTAPNNNEIESATDNSSLSSETILPIIVPSFDESSARVIQTNETTTIVEGEQPTEETNNPSSQTATNSNEYINPRGIRFTTSTTAPTATTGPVKGKEIHSFISIDSILGILEPLTPYGWPCVRGLFRFLTTLINNYDKFVFFILFGRNLFLSK